METDFIAARPTKGPYLESAMGFLAKHGITRLDDLGLIPGLPHSSAAAILRHMLELACQCSHIGNITVGRYCIQNMPRPWVLGHVELAAEPLLSPNEGWEYRRLLELYSTLDDDLTRRLSLRAIAHEDPEIQEAGRDFGGSA